MTTIINTTLKVQKITIAVATLAFCGLLYIVFATDPFASTQYLWEFFLVLVVFLSAVYLLLIFVFQFNIRKIIMNLGQIFDSIYYALILSCATVLTLILAMVEQLNIISITVILSGLILYWFANN
jgi:hypothetical protein